MMKNNILDVNCSMLLGRPCGYEMPKLHDWGNNLISIEGNGTIRTIAVTKHLDNNTKCPEVLLFYDFVNEVTYEKKDVLLVVELDLFTQLAPLLYQSRKSWQQ